MAHVALNLQPSQRTYSEGAFWHRIRWRYWFITDDIFPKSGTRLDSGLALLSRPFSLFTVSYASPSFSNSALETISGSEVCPAGFCATPVLSFSVPQGFALHFFVFRSFSRSFSHVGLSSSALTLFLITIVVPFSHVKVTYSHVGCRFRMWIYDGCLRNLLVGPHF